MEEKPFSRDGVNESNECAISLAVGGMTCAACVRAITDAVSELEGVSNIVVNQLGKSASAVVAFPDLIPSVVTLIEDIGYECTVVSVRPTSDARSATKRTGNLRSVALQFIGLKAITPVIVDALQKDTSDVVILDHHISDPSNVLRIQYTPSPPHLTIRSIISTLSAALPAAESGIQIWHPPSSDEVAQRMYRKEQRNLLFRLLVAIIAAIPIFVIGTIYMSLLKEGSPGHNYFERHIWAGQVTRGEWVLFLASTPVMFYAAEEFHRRSLQELWHLWRPGSRASWATRFFRFGSMNLLISLGVSVAYFSSVAQLAISATRDSNSAPSDGQPMTYFDSVAFLTMFLLIGRFIEAFSKHQATSAISLLGRLRSTEAFLLIDDLSSTSSPSSSCREGPPRGEKVNAVTISVDLLEVGDIVRVPPGATPPADGTIVSLESTKFDESSLTGESRNILKGTGDQVFVGAINKMRAVDIRVDAVEGETMIDEVIEAVRQGQTKRAPIERIVDVITSHIVPVITALAIVTWIIWLNLGLSGVLPPSTLEGNVGGWAFWSLEFAISVFVIACPCGIGLAAPTALLVGSGLAAKFGILARGGGEAFQEASQIDVIVFDKTGTLTEGTEPKVTDSTIHPSPDAFISELSTEKWNEVVAKVVLQLASASSHPLCLSLRNHFGDSDWSKDGLLVAASTIDEHAGCGMSGTFTIETSRGGEIVEVSVFLGNETWLQDKDVSIDHDRERMHHLRTQGKSIVLLAMNFPTTQAPALVGVFAIADPIRPEAQNVIAHLHAMGIETWMISGDNRVTAQAVALSVGIEQVNVIAGVLPHQKAEKIRWLQTSPKESKKGTKHRKIVAMVGDGINDAPALTAADVGIAMGSGSDIALSSAKFVLLSSDLNTLLVLSDLSRKVFRRIKFNFGWALVYNVVALPIAAGVIYPAGHARLSPVWSSLAMALSSTSVVCSSLLLRRYRKPVFDNPTPSQHFEAEKVNQNV